MRLLLPVIALGVLILCITLFFEGAVGSGQGHDAERRMRRTFRRYERKSDDNAGRFGDWTKRFLAWVRRLGQRSAAGGRAIRRKITR